MAILFNGIFGELRGRVGPLVFSKRNGKTVVSRRPIRRKGENHPTQLAQQAKFLLCMGFLNPLRSLLNQTYKMQAKTKLGFNKMFAYNIKHAICGTYPNVAIDYSMVRLSRGWLPNPGSPVCEIASPGMLKYTWSPCCELVLARPDDKAFVAVYSPSLKQWIYRQDCAQRKTGTATLDISCLHGQPGQTYLGFISADGKMASESVFTGTLNG